MMKSMNYACQSLHDVLEDIESSFTANSDRIKSVINKENEEDNVTEFNDTVEAICQDMDENLHQLVEHVNASLDIYLDSWRAATPTARYKDTLFTAFSPGDRVVVAITASTPPSEINALGEENDSVRLDPQKPMLSRRQSGGWDDESLPYPIADQYKSGTVLMMTPDGLMAKVKFDCDDDQSSDVPLVSISQLKRAPSAVSSFNTENIYQVGQMLLIQQKGLPGTFKPAILMEVNHQYQGDGNKSNPSASCGPRHVDSTHSAKEISVQYRSSEISRLVVDNSDPLHNCSETCSCNNILLHTFSWSTVSATSRHTIGFLLGQIPDLISYHAVNLFGKMFMTSSQSKFQNALDESIHRHWQRCLQSIFYRIDREMVSFNRIIRGSKDILSSSTESYSSSVAAMPANTRTSAPSCGLKELSTFANNDVERIHDMIFPSNLQLTSSSSNHNIKNSPQMMESSAHTSHNFPLEQQVSSTWQNMKYVGPTLSARGDSYHIISCQDDFTYSNRSVMPFQFDDVPIGLCSEDLNVCGFDGQSAQVTLCQRIRHVCKIFEELFAVGVVLLDSIHHHSYKNDFLFSTAEVEMKNIEQAHLASWFDNCPNEDDDTDAIRSTKADCDQDDQAYFSDDSEFNDDGQISPIPRISRVNSGLSTTSISRNRSESRHHASSDNRDSIQRTNSNVSNVPSLNLDEVLPDDDVMAIKKQPISNKHDILGGSSRLLQLLVSIANLSNKYLLKIVGQLPCPFEVDTQDWGLTLNSILTCRNYLISLMSKINLWHTSFSSTYQQKVQVLATFNHTIDPVEALLLQVAAEMHETIPLKIDEAVSYISHTMESVVVSSIWREEWHATSAYKKGQKVSPGVLSLMVTCKGLLYDFIQTLKTHGNVLRRLSAAVISVSLRAVLNAYNAVKPSRVRQVQLQKDLSASLSSFVDIIQVLLDEGILPSEEAEDQRTDGGKNTDTPKMPSLEQFKHLPSIHDAQRMAFQYTFKQCGDLFKTDRLHSLNAIVNEFCKRETTQSGDTDPIPHMMSALHIEDYGFGDPEQQFMTLLKDNLLELILLTHINVSSSSSMNEFLSTLGDNRHDTWKKVTKPRKRRNSGGLDAFDSFYNSSSGNVGYPEGLLVLKPLLIQSNVCLNSKIAEVTAKTLQGLLTCVVVSDKAKKNKILGGIFNPLTTLSGVLYDAGQELLSCHGSINTKAGELFCTVDPKVLTLMTANAQYVLTLLSLHRRELLTCVYPPLTDEELDTKDRMETFLSSYECDVAFFESAIASSKADMDAIIDSFVFRAGDGIDGKATEKSSNDGDVAKRNEVAAENCGTMPSFRNYSFTERSVSNSSRTPRQCGDDLEFHWDEV